jgi:hypothetical protein
MVVIGGIIIHDTTPVQPPIRPLPPTSEKYTSYGISQSSAWFCASNLIKNPNNFDQFMYHNHKKNIWDFVVATKI